MRIPLYDNLYLTSDTTNIMIAKKSFNKKENVDTYVPIGYYSSVESALMGLRKMKLRESEATSLQDLLEESKQFHNWVKGVVGV